MGTKRFQSEDDDHSPLCLSKRFYLPTIVKEIDADNCLVKIVNNIFSRGSNFLLYCIELLTIV